MGERSETIVVCLFSQKGADQPDELLAQGELALAKTVSESWRMVPSVQVPLAPKKGPHYPLLKMDMQYRCSKFTKTPRGKLEVTLVRGIEMKYKGESYKPIMEFRLGT